MDEPNQVETLAFKCSFTTDFCGAAVSGGLELGSGLLANNHGPQSSNGRFYGAGYKDSMFYLMRKY